jgi:mono/diheme cytochrome c family protein
MKSLNLKVVFVASLLLLSSMACTLSLADDIIPPPGADLSGQVIEISEIEYPDSEIDLARGGEIYAQSCAPCHGESGLGDGPQAGDLPFEVPPIGSTGFGAEPSLDDWFLQVTDGNLDKFMPPFGQSYSVQERWEVLAYVANMWSSSIDWAQQFAELDLPAIFSDLETVGPLAGQEIYLDIEKSGALTNLSLSAFEQAELIGYLKLLALGVAEIEEQASEVVIEENELDATIGEDALEIAAPNGIQGQIVNGGGGEIPTGLEVVMHATDNTEAVEIAQVGIDPDGMFLIEDIETDDAHRYFFSVDVQGLTFFSSFYSDGQFEAQENVLLEFFESSQAIEKLQAEVIILVFNFTSEGQVRVIQQVVLSNSGTKAAAPSSDGQPLIHYELPTNAANLLFESGLMGERYFAEDEGFGDVRAVLPGNSSYQILFAYDLPYNRELEFDIALQFESANLGIFVPQDLINLENEKFVYQGPQVVETLTYDSYLYSDKIDAGDSISFQLNGLHPLNKSAWQRLINNRSLLTGIIALLGTLTGGWWWFRSARLEVVPKNAMNQENILDAIVDLDRAFDASEISERNYFKQRDALKIKLSQTISHKKKIAK